MISHRGAAGRRGAPTPRTEAGETLTELLVTVTILGIGIVTLLGAIWGAIAYSDSHRKATSANNELTSVAEAVVDNVAYPYADCATTATYSPLVVRSEYTATITSVRYWDGNSQPAGWGASCAAGADKGVQSITIEVTSPAPRRARETVTVVKRRDTCPTSVNPPAASGERC